jgi:hypothetical protein
LSTSSNISALPRRLRPRVRALDTAVDRGMLIRQELLKTDPDPAAPAGGQLLSAGLHTSRRGRDANHTSGDVDRDWAVPSPHRPGGELSPSKGRSRAEHPE